VKREELVIVTPALAASNSGNWRTAQRWARFLAADYRVRVTDAWHGGDEALMIALHAQRSAEAIAAWRERQPRRPLLLALTGTDLYRDIDRDPAAQRSLAVADRLIVLNELGAARLPPALRSRATVVLQSAPARRPRPKTTRHLRAVMVGHLRPEKSPQTAMAAMQRLAPRRDILLDHIGAALDDALAAEAGALMQRLPTYRWLGPLPHGATRARIAAAHLLVHPSRIEGGAHAVIEAVVSGTPVLASRIDGNVGLLGADYGGYFEPGDDAALARLLARARDDPAWLGALRAQCAARAPLFAPARERGALRRIVQDLLAAAD
jgi:putative glycosyltransferase (TIGR04348 family)